jgi:hypothetical protein
MRPSGSTAASIVLRRPVAEVLDPLDRRSRFARSQAQRDDVGEHRLLHAEAAPGVARHPQAQLRGRHPEREGHHRVQGKRAHEVGQHVVAFAARQMLRHDHEALDRGAGIGRIADRQAHAMGSGCKGSIGIAIDEAPIADDIGADRLVQHGRPDSDGRVDAGGRGERFVLDPHKIERILGDIAVLGHHHRNRLAGVTSLVHRQAPVLHRRLHPDHERRRPAGDVGAGEDRAHPWQGQRSGSIDLQNARMRVGGAHERRMQRPGPHTHVVGKVPRPGEQRRILAALKRPPGPRLPGRRRDGRCREWGSLVHTLSGGAGPCSRVRRLPTRA